MTTQGTWIGDDNLQPEIKATTVTVIMKKHPVGDRMYLELPANLSEEEANKRIEIFMAKVNNRDQSGGNNSFKW